MVRGRLERQAALGLCSIAGEPVAGVSLPRGVCPLWPEPMLCSLLALLCCTNQALAPHLPGLPLGPSAPGGAGVKDRTPLTLLTPTQSVSGSGGTGWGGPPGPRPAPRAVLDPEVDRGRPAGGEPGMQAGCLLGQPFKADKSLCLRCMEVTAPLREAGINYLFKEEINQLCRST